MKIIIRTTLITIVLAIGFIFNGCGVYSFSGTSIQPDIETFSVEYFKNKALLVNPSLANNITEALIDKYRKLTKLEQVTEVGDLNIYGEITGYEIKPMAITSDEVAAQNRLTISLKLTYTNKKYPEDDFESNFAAYTDYDSTQQFESVEQQLCDEIIEILIEDIFNATVAKW